MLAKLQKRRYKGKYYNAYLPDHMRTPPAPAAGAYAAEAAPEAFTPESKAPWSVAAEDAAVVVGLRDADAETSQTSQWRRPQVLGLWHACNCLIKETKDEE